MACFELGPIRPPSEAESILLRLTRNCHWNKCVFCPVYKNTQFSMRKVDEVKKDIDTMARIAEQIYKKLKEQYPDRMNNSEVVRVIKELHFNEDIDEGCVRQVAFWIYHGMKSLFLQDADALVLRTDHLVDILNYVRDKFSTIERITTYSRAKTISRKSIEELIALRGAGLNRIHIGMESGSDAVLELICKGVTQEEQILAGRNVIKAGFELSEYFMPGVGGKEHSEENVAGSAEVLNATNPTFIRIRSTVPRPGTPLYDMMLRKEWTPLTEEEKVGEIKALIEHLQDITSSVKSDHFMNLLEDVDGTIPDDTGKMLAVIQDFQGMNQDDKESFIVGRRLGRYRYLSDFVPMQEIEMIKREIKNKYSTVDEGVYEILVNYI
jgi:histone acetyltransferase (RNA polymerase elongator complex component)